MPIALSEEHLKQWQDAYAAGETDLDPSQVRTLGAVPAANKINQANSAGSNVEKNLSRGPSVIPGGTTPTVYGQSVAIPLLGLAIIGFFLFRK